MVLLGSSMESRVKIVKKMPFFLISLDLLSRKSKKKFLSRILLNCYIHECSRLSFNMPEMRDLRTWSSRLSSRSKTGSNWNVKDADYFKDRTDRSTDFWKKGLKLFFSCSTRSNASWSKWCRSIRTTRSRWFPWCCRFRLFVRFYFTFTSRWTISKIQPNFWPDGSRIRLWASRKITFLCCWMGKGNSILPRTSNYWPGKAILPAFSTAIFVALKTSLPLSKYPKICSKCP